MRENDVERKQLLMKRIIGFNKNNFIQQSFKVLYLQYNDDKPHSRLNVYHYFYPNLISWMIVVLDNLPRQF